MPTVNVKPIDFETCIDKEFMVWNYTNGTAVIRLDSHVGHSPSRLHELVRQTLGMRNRKLNTKNSIHCLGALGGV